MSDHISEGGQDAIISAEPIPQGFNYPWAAAPDIIRAHQKDAYFQSILLSQLSSVVRSLYGARTEHKWANEASIFTELLYLALTTFIGNRTLGEEYCDVVQVEDDSHQLPSILRRSGYIVSSVLLPYALTHFLPALRRRLRAKLEATIRKAHKKRVASPTRRSSSVSLSSSASAATRQQQQPHLSTQDRVLLFQEYVLKHIDTLTSPAPVYAVSLAVFYFSGAYYQLSKRVFGLRYVFTRKVEESDQRAGYEVLGVLLVLQMAVQGYMHARETWNGAQQRAEESSSGSLGSLAYQESVGGAGGENHFNSSLLFDAHPRSADPELTRKRVAAITHTPLAQHDPSDDPDQEPHRHNLANPATMQWIDGKQQRKCTLCLEPMKDPSVTTCGHTFCWTCVTDWLREQPNCPLCRQSALLQHVLPLRG